MVVGVIIYINQMLGFVVILEIVKFFWIFPKLDYQKQGSKSLKQGGNAVFQNLSPATSTLSSADSVFGQKSQKFLFLFLLTTQ